MNQDILNELQKITPEEEQILAGNRQVDTTIYLNRSEPAYSSKQVYLSDQVYDSGKLMEAGRLIAIRKHTRFIDFPKHSHNYVEVIYVCKGSLNQVINGVNVCLEQGELLFLSQNAVHEITAAKEGDLAINFIILPEFFDAVLPMIDEANNPLREFVLQCLRGSESNSSFIHFKVADVLPVQNLVENLIWSLMEEHFAKRSIIQVTMGLLFMELLDHLKSAELNTEDEGRKLLLDVLCYIDEHYREGTLTDLAGHLHYDIYWLSKEIKSLTGQTYTELLQNKRLSRAEYLLAKTSMPIADIGLSLGYENLSYFHRIFKSRYGLTPKKYRDNTH